MLRFPTLLAYGLLSLGTSQAQVQPTPEKLLSRAISQVELCPSHTDITDMETGLRIFPTHEDKAVGKKTDPRKIFRDGRFQISIEYEGWNFYQLRFTPWPSEKQLKALPGESENVERAINHVSGTIRIDKETGSIIVVDGNLPSKLKYKGGLGAVYTLTFNATQVLRNGRWVLSKGSLIYHYRRLFGKTHKKYETLFDCK